MAKRVATGHGIEDEPALSGRRVADGHGDGEARADQALKREASRGGMERHAILQSIDGEPFTTTRASAAVAIHPTSCCARCGYALRGTQSGSACPECGFSLEGGYARWLEEKRSSTPRGLSWALVTALVLVGGLWAVVGAFIAAFSGAANGGFLGLVIVGPLVEEVMKVALIAIVVERSPYLVKSAAQIVVAAVTGGLTFAAIENLIYLNLYIPNPSELIVTWRWTVCVAMHITCSAIAGLGVLQVWRRTMSTGRPPELGTAVPWLAAAAVTHGAYNALALLLEWTGVVF